RTRPQAARWINVPEILTKDLIKVYRTGKAEVIALRGLDLHIRDGELVAIRGPSGCGKTTFLNILGGIDRPTAGRIEVNGSNLVDMSDGELVRYRLRQAGFVFQFFNLVPTLSAEENIELPMRLASKNGTARQARTKELLDLVGLAHRARHRPDEMSGGEQQRIAIAVCTFATLADPAEWAEREWRILATLPFPCFLRLSFRDDRKTLIDRLTACIGMLEQTSNRPRRKRITREKPGQPSVRSVTFSQ